MTITWQTVAITAVIITGLVVTAIFAPQFPELLLSEAVLGVVIAALSKKAVE